MTEKSSGASVVTRKYKNNTVYQPRKVDNYSHSKQKSIMGSKHHARYLSRRYSFSSTLCYIINYITQPAKFNAAVVICQGFC